MSHLTYTITKMHSIPVEETSLEAQPNKTSLQLVQQSDAFTNLFTTVANSQESRFSRAMHSYVDFIYIIC